MIKEEGVTQDELEEELNAYLAGEDLRDLDDEEADPLEEEAVKGELHD